MDLDDGRVDEFSARKLSFGLHGLQQATLRFESAHWHREEDAFTAAAEAVSWAVAIDTVLEHWVGGGRDSRTYKRHRGLTEDGKTIIAMKFVRNHVHHATELLDFVFLTGVVGGPAGGYRALWIWKPLDDLEAFLNPTFTSGKGLYESHLAERPVTHALLDANRWFSSLEPPIPPLPDDPTGQLRDPFKLPERWPPIEGDRQI